MCGIAGTWVGGGWDPLKGLCDNLTLPELEKSNKENKKRKEKIKINKDPQESEAKQSCKWGFTIKSQLRGDVRLYLYSLAIICSYTSALVDFPISIFGLFGGN